eukprot:CAMPEP_0197736732 /NCGR_PEP_ID=MMETSP1435-20131217/3543_1 /TAXON_ID=426625 /ORGANISM="Chaetoceros brevis, Strain CCMP164" /LENGTH=62 /DNA_ID=CAMNT_0043324961 /DNA_START=67 /DNA_END=255 /DNA_ORIENTATION=+
MVHPNNETHTKNESIPETKTEEGSSKRNILRKNTLDPHRKQKKQGGGGGGKGKWDPLNDGTF